MRSFYSLLASEGLKLRKSPIWLLVPISPFLMLLIGMLMNLDGIGEADRASTVLSTMAMMHSILLLPIMTGVWSAFVCRYEHGGGGWKQLLALPISRTELYLAKLAVVALLVLAAQLLFLAAAWLVMIRHGIEPSWRLLLGSVVGGWAACLPLAALQLAVSTLWSSFAAPLALNVMLVLPNMMVVNSADISPFYPWAQPTLLMMSGGTMDFGGYTIPYWQLLTTVIGSFLVFLTGGLAYFNRKEI
ncbi:ABC transporter permease [Paenibacillus sp. NPDC058071]|uniref:ABC transporter permease n=1 Tax=Paenibacillus sp. NPDC058071 TaxID=3346326 RepID=UPI0036DF8D33